MTTSISFFYVYTVHNKREYLVVTTPSDIKSSSISNNLKAYFSWRITQKTKILFFRFSSSSSSTFFLLVNLFAKGETVYSYATLTKKKKINNKIMRGNRGIQKIIIPIKRKCFN